MLHKDLHNLPTLHMAFIIRLHTVGLIVNDTQGGCERGKGEGKRKGREAYDCCVLHVVVVLINVISDCNCKLRQLQQRKQREKTERERGGGEGERESQAGFISYFYNFIMLRIIEANFTSPAQAG